LIDQATDTSISLRLSVTDRCQLRCAYCMPADGTPKRTHDKVLRFEEIVRFVRVVRRHFALAKVHLTGGDPLVRPGIDRLVAMLADEGVADLAMTTNGLALGRLAPALRRAGLRRVNVSLDSLDPTTYRGLTRGGNLPDALQGIAQALRVGLTPVKLNTVVLRGVNDTEVLPLARWAISRGLPIRLLELMPIGCAKSQHAGLFVPEAEILDRLRSDLELTPLPHRAGASAVYYRAVDPAGKEGRIGFISPQTRPFCAGCRRLRLTSAGQLIGCLRLGTGPAVQPLLRRQEDEATDRELCRLIATALPQKAPRRSFATTKTMAGVGG
jgi:cyclic pyranopterin phosphate synthase